MKPSEAAEIEAKKTYAAFIKYSKAAVYWILAILILLAFFDFGVDNKTGSQYNGKVYSPMNMGVNK
jgi:hypothetical protein|tara:strand:+ start:223 stop:420 length:198 start_codon:yes stop_codon:yes gene_type:complete